ncbi:hypothetical protein [Singulisphaera acidiphila]|uniref:Uncharacterized protein n=1 Tax=Singulisphaera acidiphila (strain ATCC BAA-1392 / DSM 18658 / VKM B-2454 / MOB10) TaxID=886293 RepID=L0D8K2_SINAD|nr:hypothetical protein [Singulisphaera acidiphila]AGA25734.1 hypothetical protein Sinac_1349 [Singulisphaera acidiphila DSM 18658]
MARATSAEIRRKRALVELSIRGGTRNVRVGDYFVAFFEAADAEVVAFKSLLAPKTGLPAGTPGPMFGCSVGPVSDKAPPQPETPQRPSNKTPTVCKAIDRTFMLPPHDDAREGHP